MNILHNYSLRSLSKYRMRTVVTIIGIILSTSMITAIASLVSSITNYGKKISQLEYGNWFVYLANVPDEIHNELIHDSSVSTIMSLKYEGYAMSDSQNEYKPYICVQSASETFFKNMPLTLIDGRFPENDTEILVSSHYNNYCETPLKIGDSLTLDLGFRYTASETHLGQHDSMENTITNQPNIEYLEHQTTKTYTIVGICERPNFESFAAPGFTFFTCDSADLPCSTDTYQNTTDNTSTNNIITNSITANNADTCDTNTYRDEYVLLKYASKAIPMCNKYSSNYYSATNTSLLRYYGFSTSDTFNMILYNMGGILIIIVIIGSVSLIHNSFTISLNERTREFGLLSSIGTTKKQLKQIIRYEAAILCTIAVPLGILAGITGIGITLNFIKAPIEKLFSYSDALKSAESVSLSLHVSYLAVIIASLLSIATVYISSIIPMHRALKHSAIDAISQRNTITVKGSKISTPILVSKIFGIEGTIAYKNYKRNKRSYRTIIFSLSISIIMFISSGAFSAYTLERYNDDTSISYCDLKFTGYMDYDEIPDFFDMHSAIKESDSIDYSECFLIDSSLYTVGELNESYAAKLNYNESNITPIRTIFIDDNEYNYLLTQYNLISQFDNINYSDISTPILFNYFINYAATLDDEYAMPVITPVFTNPIQNLTLINDYEGKISNSIDANYYTNGDSQTDSETLTNILDAYPNLNDFDTTNVIPVASIIPDSYENQPKTFHSKDENISYPTSGVGPFLVYPLSAYTNVINNVYTFTTPPVDSYYIYVSVKVKDYNKAKALINRLIDNKNFFCQDSIQDEMEYRSALLMIQILTYGFTTLISLICIANIFNTLSTSMDLRKREFAMLRSIGLSKQQFRKMLNFECLIYSIKGSAFGLIISFIICLIMYHSGMGSFAGFYLPLKYFIVAIIFTIIIIYISIIYGHIKQQRNNIVDTLTRESI